MSFLKNMEKFWAVICKNCRVEIAVAEFNADFKMAHWPSKMKIECLCSKTHEYAGDKFHVSEGIAPL